MVVRKSTSHRVVLSYDPNVEGKTDMNIRGKKFPGRKTSRAKALRQKGLEAFQRWEGGERVSPPAGAAVMLLLYLKAHETPRQGPLLQLRPQ